MPSGEFYSPLQCWAAKESGIVGELNSPSLIAFRSIAKIYRKLHCLDHKAVIMQMLFSLEIKKVDGSNVIYQIIDDLCIVQKYKTMAKPIKKTPVLEGKDARRFAENAGAVKPEPNEVIKKAMVTFEKFQKIATFQI